MTQKLATAKDLGNVLTIRLSSEDSVVSTANKARRILVYLNRYFVTLTPTIFPFVRHIVWAHFRCMHVQKPAVKFVKAFGMFRIRQLRLLSLTRRRSRDDLIFTFKATHCVLVFLMESIFIHPTRKGLRGYTFN